MRTDRGGVNESKPWWRDLTGLPGYRSERSRERATKSMRWQRDHHWWAACIIALWTGLTSAVLSQDVGTAVIAAPIMFVMWGTLGWRITDGIEERRRRQATSCRGPEGLGQGEPKRLVFRSGPPPSQGASGDYEITQGADDRE